MVAAAERGGKRFAGNKNQRGRGGRNRARGGGNMGAGGVSALSAKVGIDVDAQGIATVTIRVLPKRWRDQSATPQPEIRARPEKEDKSAEERKEGKREKEARKMDAAYAHARTAALAQVGREDGGFMVSKALASAIKFVSQAQRCIDAKSEQMQQMDLAAEGEDAATLEAVKLCADCVEINKHVRAVLTGILWRKELDDLATKQQEKLLELLLLSHDWCEAFDVSNLPLPSWLMNGVDDARKGVLRSSTAASLAKTIVTAQVKHRRNDLFQFLTEFVTKFFSKKGCDEAVRISIFIFIVGSIAATPLLLLLLLNSSY